MKSLISLLKRIPVYARWPIAITVVTQCLTYYAPKLLGSRPQHLLTSALDEAIPVLPWFVYIYVLAYLLWVVNYLWIYCSDASLCRRMLTADLLCKAVCALCFVLYPCTLLRPQAESLTGVGAWLLKLIYRIDTPTSLLPSMHCHLSVLVSLPLFDRRSKAPRWYAVGSLLFSLLVCASTVFTKQHVMADVYTGVALAAVAWGLTQVLWNVFDRRKAGV